MAERAKEVDLTKAQIMYKEARSNLNNFLSQSPSLINFQGDLPSGHQMNGGFFNHAPYIKQLNSIPLEVTLRQQPIPNLDPMYGDAGRLTSGISGQIEKSRYNPELLQNMELLGIIKDASKAKLFSSESLKRTHHYQQKKNMTLLQNGYLGSLPPEFGGPPLASNSGLLQRQGPYSLNQWNRLDPGEILVHSVKCQDQLDDFLESQMRKKFVKKFEAQAAKALE